MTKVLGICCTASPKSSTKKLVQTALASAEKAGATVEFVDEAKLNLHGCIGCNFCKMDQKNMCAQKDDMTELYDKINSSDVLLIGSPIYFGKISGQAKCFIDRLYAYLGPDGSKMKTGKKTAAILTHGVEDVNAYVQEAEVLVAPFKMFGAEVEYPFIVGGVHEASELEAADLREAELLGERLVK